MGPGSHRLLWVLTRAAALLLVLVGLITAVEGRGETPPYPQVAGLCMLAAGLLLERNHSRWLCGRWVARCPACGETMDMARRLWEAPDDSPQWYVEYRCRACPTRHTSDVLGKAIFGWPPREPYEHPAPRPWTVAEAVKLAIVVILSVLAIALLQRVG